MSSSARSRSADTVATADSVLNAIGPRLREMRSSRHFTLLQLSGLTGLTTSTLSRLETGRSRPTLEQLLPLAKAYGLPLDDLVNAPRTGDPRVHLKPVKRFGLTFIPLTSQAAGIQAFKIIHPPVRGEQRISQQTHDGYEWVYVLSGAVELALGERHETLREGEAAEFDTRTPHWIGNASPHPSEVLMLFTALGERLHLAHQHRHARTVQP